MPKIIRFHKLGGPEVLKIEEETSKQPGKGEVRLQVQAVGLNRAELMFVRGLQPALCSLGGQSHHLPSYPFARNSSFVDVA
jgi:NADPH:quinone reductase-like Zn-dependent oxidoreductase